MRSVADDLRSGTRERVLAMTVPARIALALSLGDEDLDRFASTSGLLPHEALSILRAQRARGRRVTSKSASGS
jgi:hypothetical protein